MYVVLDCKMQFIRSIIILKFTFSLCLAEFEKDLQLQLILAEPGDTIKLSSGLFPILGTLSMEGKENIVIKGTGMNSTTLNFSTQVEGAQGLSITNCKNIILEDLLYRTQKAMRSNASMWMASLSVGSKHSGWVVQNQLMVRMDYTQFNVRMY